MRFTVLREITGQFGGMCHSQRYKVDARKKSRFVESVKHKLCVKLNSVELRQVEYCKVSYHKGQLKQIIAYLPVDYIRQIGAEVFGSNIAKWYVTPGWNTHVKVYFNELRKTFTRWREAASPRDGLET